MEQKTEGMKEIERLTKAANEAQARARAAKHKASGSGKLSDAVKKIIDGDIKAKRGTEKLTVKALTDIPASRGTVYTMGCTVTVDAETAEKWIAKGWAVQYEA